jgi:hypothetical protein
LLFCKVEGFKMFGEKKAPPKLYQKQFQIPREDVSQCYCELRDTFIENGAISYDDLRYNPGLPGAIKEAAVLQCKIDVCIVIETQLESEVEMLRSHRIAIKSELESSRFWPIGYKKRSWTSLLLGIVSAAFTGVGLGSILSGMIGFDPSGIFGWIVGIGLLVAAYSVTLSTIDAKMVESVTKQRLYGDVNNKAAKSSKIKADCLSILLIVVDAMLTYWSYAYVVVLDPTSGASGGLLCTAISFLMTVSAVEFARSNVTYHTAALQRYADKCYSTKNRANEEDVILRNMLHKLKQCGPDMKQKKKHLEQLSGFNQYLQTCFESLCRGIEGGTRGEQDDEVDSTRRRPSRRDAMYRDRPQDPTSNNGNVYDQWENGFTQKGSDDSNEDEPYHDEYSDDEAI